MKKFLALLIVMVLMVSAVGCASNSSENTTPGKDSETSEEVKIQFMHTMIEQERQEIIDGIIKDFEAKNPGIKVEQMPTDEDSYETKITALGNSGELPAIMEMSQD